MNNALQAYLYKTDCGCAPTIGVGADLVSPFPGYHRATWRPGAQGMWRDYDGESMWWERDRRKLGTQAGWDAIRAKEARKAILKKVTIGGVVASGLALLTKLAGVW